MCPLTIIDWIIILAGAGFLIWFSWWFSVKEGRYHGIARFFGFMGIYLLVWSNIPVWFHNPFSMEQLLSWLLLIISAVYGILGFLLLINRGKPEGKMENTTKLVETGLYHYIRHPLYGSLLFLSFGIWLKQINDFTSIIATINLLAFYITARIEEGEMINRFGEEYSAYMNRTKMFIPYLF
jgi:protein-S-isoprenylcysteine O-methyltransferase Ste14